MSSMRINPVTGFPEPYDDGYGLISPSMPKVERGKNVPSWMIDNPDYNPMAPKSNGHAGVHEPCYWRDVHGFDL